MPPRKPSKQPRSQPKTARPGVRSCGLCGKAGPLTRTECCNQWICDDEASYRLFSYARNSCSRNHRRFTLCAFHSAERHSGSWQDCSRCRKEFEVEMYVYYGTNEYNFEVLPNPPDFKPTLCSRCTTRISLGEDGYMRRGTKYFCLDCAPSPRGARGPHSGTPHSE
jgi:hypothetical protein